MRYRSQLVSAVIFVCASGLVTLMACAPGTEAQLRVRAEDVVTLKLDPAKIEDVSGEPFTITLAAKIKEGYHTQSNKPLEEYLIPTSVEIISDDFELVEVVFPEGELKSFSFSEEKLSVYDGTVRAELTLKAKEGTAAGDYTINLDFHYQACNDRICLRPTKKQISLAVTLR